MKLQPSLQFSLVLVTCIFSVASISLFQQKDATTKLESVASLSQIARAVNCPTNLKASYPAPVVADGWSAQLIVQGLKSPRSVLFDTAGNLLVVDEGSGIVHLQFTDHGSTCLEVSKTTYLINSTLVSARSCVQHVEQRLTPFS